MDSCASRKGRGDRSPALQRGVGKPGASPRLFFCSEPPTGAIETCLHRLSRPPWGLKRRRDKRMGGGLDLPRAEGAVDLGCVTEGEDAGSWGQEGEEKTPPGGGPGVRASSGDRPPRKCPSPHRGRESPPLIPCTSWRSAPAFGRPPAPISRRCTPCTPTAIPSSPSRAPAAETAAALSIPS